MTSSSKSQRGRFRDFPSERREAQGCRRRAVLELDGERSRRPPEARRAARSVRYSHRTTAPLWSVSRALYAGVLGVSRDPLVSSDIVGDPRASVVDLELTKVIDGDLVKIMSWYDNEWGYANQLMREARSLARRGL
jgi:Glyceraldehyde 3-phosphate dehydrogenase, C-terminal domain